MYNSLSSPLATSKKKYMETSNSNKAGVNGGGGSSSSPFLSFCAVCDNQIEGSTLYCSDECREQDYYANTKLPAFTVLNGSSSSSSSSSLSLSSAANNENNNTPGFDDSETWTQTQSSMKHHRNYHNEPARPPSPIEGLESHHEESAVLSTKASSVSLYSSSLFLSSNSSVSARRKASALDVPSELYSPSAMHSPIAGVISEDFDLEPLAGNFNQHRISAPTLGQQMVGGPMQHHHQHQSSGYSSPHLGPAAPRPRRQSFYVRSGSQLLYSSGTTTASTGHHHHHNESIDIPSKNRTSVSSASNLTMCSDSPRSINLVMPNTPIEAPVPELDYHFPKCEKRTSTSSTNSLHMKKLFY